MKTIGYCEGCAKWSDKQKGNFRPCSELAMHTKADFGCIHWKAPLKTLEKHKEEMTKKFVEIAESYRNNRKPYPSGLICPDCGSEMMWTNELFGYGPVWSGIKCNCGLNGKINSMSGNFERIEQL